MGETASQVDRPLSEVDTFTLVLDLTLARIQKLEALVAHLANAELAERLVDHHKNFTITKPNQQTKNIGSSR